MTLLPGTGRGISRRLVEGARVSAAQALGPLHHALAGAVHAQVRTSPGSSQPVRGTGAPEHPVQGRSEGLR